MLHTGAQPPQHVALIDASYYCFRFHHAFASFSRRNGPNARLQSGGPHSEDTAILHMFLKFVLKIVVDALKHQVRQEPSNCDSPFGAPTSLVVVFDSVRDPEAVHVRRALCPDYKVRCSLVYRIFGRVLASGCAACSLGASLADRKRSEYPGLMFSALMFRNLKLKRHAAIHVLGDFYCRFPSGCEEFTGRSLVQMNRSESEVPAEVATALTELPGVLAHMGVKCIGLPNVEADDLIATLAAHYSESSSSSCVTIYSADKVRARHSVLPAF